MLHSQSAFYQLICIRCTKFSCSRPYIIVCVYSGWCLALCMGEHMVNLKRVQSPAEGQYIQAQLAMGLMQSSCCSAAKSTCMQLSLFVIQHFCSF